jgi:LPS export ABC transporter permease LptG/LPS export ABC transporter permease LptF
MTPSLTPRRRPGRTLYRYVAREARRPFFFALFGLTLVVLTRDLIGFSELVINRGLGVGEVGRIAFYEAVPVASAMFPFAVMIGALVALGRLGADCEILVLEASGVSASRLVGPVVAFALVMSGVSLGLSIWGAPFANRGLDADLERISRQQPWAQFRAGSVSRFGGWQVEAREVSAGGDELRGVLLWMPDIAETIFARSARVGSSADGSVEIALESGSLVFTSDAGVQQLRFEVLTTTLPQSEERVTRTEAEQLAGLPLPALVARVNAFEKSDEEPLSRAAAELHRRAATPVATLIFGFLAVPLFLARRHFSRSGGSMLGVVTTIVYFVLIQFGEGLSQAGTLSAAAGAWLPDAVLGSLAAVLLFRIRREGVLGHAFDRPQRREGRLLGRALAFASHSAGKPRRLALQRYIGARFLELTIVSFGVLLTAYVLIDVMERLDWFARYQATGFDVIRFYTVRIPLLASRVVPMALLIGSALVVSLLAVEGELIGMRACGIPAPRALLPVFALTLLVAPGYFLLRNVVVPRTNALADELKQKEIKGEYYRALEDRRKTAVWQRTGSQVLEAERFDTERGEARALTIYEIGADGLPVSRADATSARHIGRGIWRLRDPQRIEVHDGRARRVPAERYADLGMEVSSDVDTMHLSLAALSREIDVVEADGYDATPLRVDFHVKLSDALACVLLPVSALLFAVGGPPFPGPAKTLLVSGALAVGYILLTGVSASLGYAGSVPPAVGGWGPTIVFTLLAGALALRLNRRL